MRYNIRCSNEKCKARGVTEVHPDEWKRTRRCWSCGGTKFRVDWTHMRRDTKGMSCACGGYKHWEGAATGAIHRKGSKLCWYREDGTQRMPGDPDFCDPEYEANHAA